MPSPPVRRESLVNEAVAMLREEILSGELAPGARVHLHGAAERFGMSAVPIREALSTLVAEGFVIALPQRGYRVAELSEADFEDTYRVRLMLDVEAVQLAVPNFDQERRDELIAAFNELAEAYESQDWTRHGIEHRRFHFTIYEASGSPWLIRFLTVLWDNSLRYQRLSSGQRGPVQDRIDEHRRILDACVAGTADAAAEAMRAHLQQTIESVQAAFAATRAAD